MSKNKMTPQQIADQVELMLLSDAFSEADKDYLIELDDEISYVVKSRMRMLDDAAAPKDKKDGDSEQR